MNVIQYIIPRLSPPPESHHKSSLLPVLIARASDISGGYRSSALLMIGIPSSFPLIRRLFILPLVPAFYHIRLAGIPIM